VTDCTGVRLSSLAAEQVFAATRRVLNTLNPGTAINGKENKTKSSPPPAAETRAAARTVRTARGVMVRRTTATRSSQRTLECCESPRPRDRGRPSLQRGRSAQTWRSH
jgi:hypothetical protein